MKKSLQEIEDSYINRGYQDDKLRQALKADKEYQQILSEKKAKLTTKYKVTEEEAKKYVLATDLDFEILAKCKELEKKDLSEHDQEIVKLIKSQLLDDWRKPLMEKLNNIRSNLIL